jgi:hypothetical protein
MRPETIWEEMELLLSETRKGENRTMRWYEHAEQVMERLLGNGHHKEEEEEKYK